CTEPATEPVPHGGPLHASSATADCSESSAPNFDLCWPIGSTIRLAPGAGATTSSLGGAIAMWDAVLDDPRAPGLPRFVATSSTATADYIITISGGGPYCGFEEGGTITLTTNCGFGSRRGGLTEALAHELTEPYGFSAALESGYGQPGFSDHCLNHLENAGDIINGSFCQHELEIIHKAYGYRLTSIQNDSPGLWARHILTGFDLNRSQVIFSATSQTEQIAVLHL